MEVADLGQLMNGLLDTRAGGGAFSAIEPGQRIRLVFSRDGVEQVVELVAEERPIPEAAATP